MKKLFIVLLFCAVSVYSLTFKDSTVVNWNGWLDTSSIGSVLVDGTVQYTRARSLTDGEDIRIICKVNDTAETGFASDSIYFEWGYQTGDKCLNGSDLLDTCWDDRIVIDTMNLDSLGTDNVGYTSADGSITRYYGGADTSNVTGFAIQSRWIVPEWGTMFRIWVNSLGDPSKDAAGLDLYFDVKRRKYSHTQR